ncbi:hypothetical protein GS636_06695 [Ruegeria sp. HKCCD4884]|uniref:DNA primase family protein n=1 Tax=Ruegeria sp. HKCCD4884 TaxID=2683022 RepID=UPI001492051C|nr:DUF5906 domain-containing protein [Ruegeria sp. HKCCD4884]NOD92469.1 hypothetical protein [Ruegeria sp. HKCCD4884]
MAEYTNDENRAWMREEMTRIANLPEMDHEPELQRLMAEAKARGYKQRITALRGMLSQMIKSGGGVSEKDQKRAEDGKGFQDRTDLIDRYDHTETAEVFLHRFYSHAVKTTNGTARWEYTLGTWQGAFYRWQGAHWSPTEPGTGTAPSEIAREIYRWMAKDCYILVPNPGGPPIPAPAEPDRKWLAEVVTAVQTLTEINQLGWQMKEPPFERAMVFANGILDVDTLRLVKPTPLFFNTISVDANWNTNAKPLHETPFKDYLDDCCVYPNGHGQDQITLLQEITGYLMATDTAAQKGFMLIGVKRSGKGTYGRLLNKLLGTVANIKTRSFEATAGMQNLIDKTLAINADMRINPKTGTSDLTEALLSIIGEDPQTVPRKYLPDWNGTLSVRFLIMSNSTPQMRDSDGVLASRFIFVEFPNSFYGIEDPGLLARLWDHRDSFVQWAFEGYKRLVTNHYQFSLSATHNLMSSEAEVQQDPVGMFLRDMVEFTGEQDDAIAVADLFAVFHTYCLNANVAGYSKEGFGKQMTKKARSIRGIKKGHVSFNRRRDNGTPFKTNAVAWRGLKFKTKFSDAEMQQMHNDVQLHNDEIMTRVVVVDRADQDGNEGENAA